MDCFQCLNRNGKCDPKFLPGSSGGDRICPGEQGRPSFVLVLSSEQGDRREMERGGGEKGPMGEEERGGCQISDRSGGRDHTEWKGNFVDKIRIQERSLRREERENFLLTLPRPPR